MKLFCVICEQEVEESTYPSHMQTQHPQGQLSSIQAQKNIPKTSNLPPGITPADLPNSEFLETVAEIEKAKSEPPPPPKPSVAPPQQVIKPITLEYKYTGNCNCGNPITTLEMDVEEKHFVIAYCLIEKKQVESREVANLINFIEIKKENIEENFEVKIDAGLPEPPLSKEIRKIAKKTFKKKVKE